MKNVGVIIFTVLIALAATSFAIASSWGRFSSRNYLIFSKRIFNYTYAYPYGLNRKVQFPEYRKTNVRTITLIQAIDNSRNKTNSYPTLLSGGPGYKYATMNIHAGKGGNLDYQLMIYGD